LNRFALSLCLSAMTVLAAGQTNREPHRIAFHDVTAIDPASGRVVPHATVVVSKARIDWVSGDETSVPRADQVVDAAGLFLMPGLWDMHVHINEDGAWAFPLAVTSGVVGMRDMGAELDTIALWRSWHQRGDVMPELCVSGPILTGSVDDPDPRVWRLSSPADATSAVERLGNAKVDHIKVHDWLTVETWRAIVDRARQVRIPVVGHLPIRVDAVEAIESGQRSIEHFGNAWGGLLLDVSADEVLLKRELRTYLDHANNPSDLSRFMTAARWDRILSTYSEAKARSLAERLRTNGTFVCPTLYSFAWLAQAHIGPPFADDARLEFLPASRRGMLREMVTETEQRTTDERERARRVYDAQVRLLRTFVDRDVQILAGTDYTQYPLLFPGLSLHDELKSLVDAGLSTLIAIRAATSKVGEYLRDDRVGCLRQACGANLILLEGNPLEDINNVSKVRAVVLAGDYISAERRTRLLDAARQPK
jgi:hypothetical protein